MYCVSNQTYQKAKARYKNAYASELEAWKLAITSIKTQIMYDKYTNANSK